MSERRRPWARPPAGEHPPLLHPAYRSTIKRAPLRPPLRLEQGLCETTGPGFAPERVGPPLIDLTRTGKGEALGQRIILSGRLLDGDGRPVTDSLIEIWQCNAAGRYLHRNDQHDAPLDPNFTGAGHAITDEKGGFRFLTIKPGAYPWRNTHNAWRPAHIHFSLFGPACATRLITQMYFPGDPLLPLDPIFNSVPDPAARQRLISTYDPELSEAEFALGFRFDIVLRGRDSTPLGS
ncbi:MAG TPA: protocatechuate 3,4-dioxygenase subunit beta [Myxococcales bacterium]|nr:protocatechuate 3,4-dioxygenase subunit beta [Myxococcales bacterium]